MRDIWAVIPVKEFDGAKHRLSGLLSPPERRLLAETMLTDVLDAVAGSRLMAGVMIVTLDPHATGLGQKIGARILTEGARDETGILELAAPHGAVDALLDEVGAPLAAAEL